MRGIILQTAAVAAASAVACATQSPPAREAVAPPAPSGAPSDAGVGGAIVTVRELTPPPKECAPIGSRDPPYSGSRPDNSLFTGSVCWPDGDIDVPLHGSGEEGWLVARLGSIDHVPRLHVQFIGLPPTLDRWLRRGRRETVVISAALEDASGAVLSLLRQTCNVKWDIWNEIFQVDKDGHDSTTATLRGVFGRCLRVDDGAFDEVPKARPVRLLVRLDVNPSGDQTTHALAPTKAAECSGVWVSGPLPTCSAGGG